MKEIVGELWDYYGKPNTVVCITTNGAVKKDGSLVMGRGCALEAKQRIPELPLTLGRLVRESGSVVRLINIWGKSTGSILVFPVKHHWHELADPALIAYSAGVLHGMAMKQRELTFVLPRPGCGNGGLDWSEVKPLLMPLPDNVWVISKPPKVAK